MTNRGYRKRLSRDLPDWRAKGWLSAEGETEILASVDGRRATFGLAAIMGVLGALLLGAGVIAFVSANWEGIPRIVRFGLLVAVMAAAYGVAGTLARRDLRAFSEASLLVAGLVFAAAIALIGQTYNLTGEFSDAVLLWEIGIIAAALLTGSATLTVLTLVGAGFWTWLNVVDLEIAPHLYSLIPILIGGAISLRLGSQYARLMAVLALGFWIAINLIGFALRFDWSPFETLSVATAAALLFWASGAILVTFSRWPELAALGHDMLWPGLAAVLLSVGLLQTAIDWDATIGAYQWPMLAVAGAIIATLLAAIAYWRGGITIIDAVGAIVIGFAAIGYAYILPSDEMTARAIGGVIVLGAALWAINHGQTGPHGVGKATGLAAFGVEVIYLYVVTLGTLIDTALAFLVGGVLFIALAYGLFRIDRRLARKLAMSAEAE